MQEINGIFFWSAIQQQLRRLWTAGLKKKTKQVLIIRVQMRTEEKYTSSSACCLADEAFFF